MTCRASTCLPRKEKKMPLKDDIYALAKLKRSKKNLEKIQDQVAELRELADNAETVLESARTARDAVQDLISSGDGDNPLAAWWEDASMAGEKFLEEIPEEAEDIGQLVSDAEGYAEEYEDCLGDPDYSAEDREEVWGNLLDALENIAGVMT